MIKGKPKLLSLAAKLRMDRFIRHKGIWTARSEWDTWYSSHSECDPSTLPTTANIHFNFILNDIMIFNLSPLLHIPCDKPKTALNVCLD